MKKSLLFVSMLIITNAALTANAVIIGTAVPVEDYGVTLEKLVAAYGKSMNIQKRVSP